MCLWAVRQLGSFLIKDTSKNTVSFVVVTVVLFFITNEARSSFPSFVFLQISNIQSLKYLILKSLCAPDFSKEKHFST